MTVRRWLAVVALLLAGAAAIVGTPAPPGPVHAVAPKAPGDAARLLFGC
jgi:hypothetical protein